MAAKKSESIDASIYIKRVVDAGIDEKTATERVNKLIATVNEVMANESIEARNNVISIKIREMVHVAKADKFVITVVSAGPRRDSNDYKRNIAYRTYDEDPETALAQGLVRIVSEQTKDAHKARDGKYIVALDNRKYWDEAGTKQNYGYGKPLKVRMSREVICIYNNLLLKAYGDIDVESGYEYEVIGRVNDATGALYINNEVAPKKLRHVADLYNVLYEAAKTSDMAFDVPGALDTDVKSTVFVQGYVLQVSAMSNGRHKIVLTSGHGSEILVFPFDENAEKAIKDTPIGCDAIVIGVIKEPTDERFNRSITAYNVVYNPKANATSKALDALKDYEF